MDTTRRTRTTRLTAAAVAGALVFTGLGASAATAAPATGPSTGSTVTTGTPVLLTPAQWADVAARASAQGDTAAAAAAQRMAVPDKGQVSTQAWGLIAKNAIKAALRYGKPYLPAKIRPYADKLYNLIDEVEGMAEVGIFTTLTSAGLPPDVARYAAQWIVTFL
ncbi:hypothetical protein [Clavibacter michiganensis]|uniref:Secreted protein n=1 Tax=Clavibacter michiganensis TaxID=28447 RepID=A0A251YJD9_9MICO|nr:hypothetical protein [Clavibacter michiganensis]OUE24334.1 hypothetical protein BFL37_10510 [Clavibacter michiganensis]